MVEGWVNGGWKGGLLLISQVPHKSCTAENKLSSVDNDPATNQNDTATNMNDTATNRVAQGVVSWLAANEDFFNF